MACPVKKEDIIEVISKVGYDANGKRVRYRDRGDFESKAYEYLKDKYPSQSVSELAKAANEVTETYMSAVRKENESSKSFGQKLKDKLTRNLIKDNVHNLVKLKTQNIPSDADIARIESIYEKLDNVKSRSERAKLLEDAKNIEDRWKDGYNNSIISSFAYLQPLFSMDFTMKTIRANVPKAFSRAIKEVFQGKGGIDLTPLAMFFNMKGRGNKAFDVLTGGVASETTLSLERGDVVSRSFEYGSNNGKNIYKPFAWISKWSARMMNTVDAFGLTTSEKLITYTEIKNDIIDTWRAQNKNYTRDELQAEIAKRMYRSDVAQIETELKDQFIALDAIPKDVSDADWNEFKKTRRYKLAFEELRTDTEYDDITLKERAERFSKRDFWKTKMTEKSDLGIGDTGVFGAWAQMIGGAKKGITGTMGNGILASQLSVSMFGYINGSNAFREDRVEKFLPYAMIKAMFLKKKIGDLKKNGEDINADTIKDAKRLQKDLLVGASWATIQLAALKPLIEIAYEAVFDDDDDDEDEWLTYNKRPIKEIGKGISVGGRRIPIAMSEQNGFLIDLINIGNAEGKWDEKLWWGFQSSLSNYYQNTNSYDLAQGLFNSATKSELVKDRKEIGFQKALAKTLADNAFGITPLPRTMIKETGSIFANEKLLEKQINQKGVTGIVTSLMYQSQKSLGIADLAFIGLNTNKKVRDYQGRQVYNFTHADVIGDQVKINEVDMVYMNAGKELPYSYYHKHSLKAKEPKSDSEEYETRYLTYDEYVDVESAKSLVRKEIYNDNLKYEGQQSVWEYIQTLDKEKQKDVLGNMEYYIQNTFAGVLDEKYYLDDNGKIAKKIEVDQLKKDVIKKIKNKGKSLTRKTKDYDRLDVPTE